MGVKIETGCWVREIPMKGCGIKNTSVGAGFANVDTRDAGQL